MDKNYTERYAELSQKHWWWRSRNHYIINECKKLLTTGENILEIGSGTGVVLKELEGYGSSTGIEPDQTLLNYNITKNSKLINCSLEDFQSAEQYSLILMLDVLEHIEDDHKAVMQISKLLKKDGYLIINVPAFQSIWTYHDQYNQHYRRYKKDQLELIIKQSGLEICKSRYTFFTLYPLKLLSRIKQRLIRSNLKIASVPTGIINNIAYSFFIWEYKRINLGLGSSLLVIAQKK